MSIVSIDDVKHFWNTRPCNSRHSSKEPGSLEYFDEVAAKRYRAEPHIQSFMNPDKWSGKRVLELGCGIGTDAIQFAKAGAKVVCIDLTKNSLSMCRKNFDVHNLEASFFEGNIEELESFLPEEYKNSFDLIYSFGVIHHTPNPKKVFHSLKSYLKDDGEVRCMLYSRFSYKLFWLMKETNNWKFSNADNIIQYHSEAQSGCPVTYTYTFDEIKDLVSPEFEVKNIWKDHIFIYNIEKYKQHIFEYDDAFEGIDEEYKKKLFKELGWHTLFILQKN